MSHSWSARLHLIIHSSPLTNARSQKKTRAKSGKRVLSLLLPEVLTYNRPHRAQDLAAKAMARCVLAGGSYKKKEENKNTAASPSRVSSSGRLRSWPRLRSLPTASPPARVPSLVFVVTRRRRHRRERDGEHGERHEDDARLERRVLRRDDPAMEVEEERSNK